MRNVVKGGVWKNVEDEILKAAVMKYGKNQWARIASLLTRKSAKQCKARWNEWLDPSIKKIDWSREEEEKLLHLAKIMPTQWRTIAPIVGRTPAQCLEHYEKLLDAAQGKDDDYDAADDPRNLRPGEIDPFPETKPARPDAIDMDEDEKEMLNEARARLANTKGKKAKRKAREKQLEESRRLASLQKRRELRAAGIVSREGGGKKYRGINYNNEVAFEKPAAAGFYDTSEEQAANEYLKEHPGRSKTLLEMEGRRRSDVEHEARAKDIDRQRKRKDTDLPAAVMQLNNLKENDFVVKRTKLNLPAPQLSEMELEAVVKAGVTGTLEDASATPRLLTGPMTPGMTPVGRTPVRTPARTPARISLMEEAQNIIALNTGSAPLLGGENKALHSGGGDFSGTTPRNRDVSTPNLMATPLRTPSQVAELDRHAQMQQRNSLKARLSQLPQPSSGDYQVAVPDLPEDEFEMDSRSDSYIEADKADVEAQRLKQARDAENERLQLRSSAVKRDLPRPRAVPTLAPGRHSAAEDLITQEMIALIANDAVTAPMPGAVVPENVAPLHFIAHADILNAELLLEEEVLQVRDLYQHDDANFAAAYAEVEQELSLYLPSKKMFVKATGAHKKDVIDANEAQLKALQELNLALHKKSARVESKLKVVLGGYENRSAALAKQIEALVEQVGDAYRDLQTSQQIYEHEKQAKARRLEKLTKEVDQQKATGRALQQRFAELQLQR
eukprot:TRINITY_DN6560_c0_g1_i1.p1 TRINITY_DN6560_c0_g1~~TRINITY_DN6560_c0_g1_i1.p1  ORF type:complete len:729 (+),score=203.83 TRINITY_DN6560_c0_g1_i1:69-2255(+)